MSDDAPLTPAPAAGTTEPTLTGDPPGNTPPGTPPQMPVEHFCAALSATDKRVELIGAFHNAERAAKRYADSHDNYQTRYVAFCAQPA